MSQAQTIVTTNSPGKESARGASNTLSILVNNSPGVLMRICQVFSRRAYNIDSLVVSEGRTGAFSRMTIAISGNPEGFEQIIKQVNKSTCSAAFCGLIQLAVTAASWRPT